MKLFLRNLGILSNIQDVLKLVENVQFIKENAKKSSFFATDCSYFLVGTKLRFLKLWHSHRSRKLEAWILSAALNTPLPRKSPSGHLMKSKFNVAFICVKCISHVSTKYFYEIKLKLIPAFNFEKAFLFMVNDRLSRFVINLVFEQKRMLFTKSLNLDFMIFR